MGCCCTKETVTYKAGTRFSEIKDQIRPLDLIVFRGSEFVSDLISFVEKLRLGEGNWTHVGMAVTTDIIPIKNGIPGKLYIWESTMSGKLLGDGADDIEKGSGTFGAQIRDLADVVDKYDNDEDSRIGWCPLINNPLDQKEGEDEKVYQARVDKLKEILKKFFEEKGHVTYDYNCCNLLSSMFPKLTCARKYIFGDSNKMFCSELVASIYQSIGLISNSINPEEVAPEEFLGFTNEEGLTSPVKLPAMVITREWPQPKEQKESKGEEKKYGSVGSSSQV